MPPKRKANEVASSSKKARTDANVEAQALVIAVLANKSTYPIPENPEEVRERLVLLAEYARSLEGRSAASGAGTAKTPEQIEAAAKKLANVIRLGLKKQMTWKASCKQGSAKYGFDGLCEDTQVFCSLFKLDGKKKRITMVPDVFEGYIGDIGASVRYNNLRLTGDKVNISYNPDSGEFKISGTYGI